MPVRIPPHINQVPQRRQEVSKRMGIHIRIATPIRYVYMDVCHHPVNKNTQSNDDESFQECPPSSSPTTRPPRLSVEFLVRRRPGELD